jgi:hypothetical protein
LPRSSQLRHWLAAAAAALALVASVHGGEPGPSVEIAWNADLARVEVTVLPSGSLSMFESRPLSQEHGAVLFKLSVAGEAATAPMLGRYAVEGDVLWFTPRFPLRPGLKYTASFNPEPAGLIGDRVETIISLPAEPPPPPAAVAAVYPSGAELPANLLKFYIHFTQPMARGDQYRHVRIVDADGAEIPDAFLELAEELWDADARRLTLLFDPGRIKRGLKPNEDVGAPLVEGREYALVIDAGWPDAHGQPLAAEFRQPFRVVALDETQPAPRAWKLDAPRAGTRRALAVKFDEPLDHALSERMIVVRDAAGREVAGAVVIDEQETRWRFRPDAPWRAGRFELVVDPALEDRAGNSVGRPFETETTEEVGAAAEEPVLLPFEVE